MLAEERFQKILVKEQKSVTVQELTERLHISESTVRRDLTVLHDRGALRKVHGGATAVDMEYAAKDESVTVRQNLNQEEKTRIGKYAASLVEPGDFVYLDAGTTTEAMVEYLTCREAVYVTNGILHAAKLAQKGCRVLVPGGEVKESTLALVGAQMVRDLEKYHFTKGFFGTNGVDSVRGFTTPEPAEALGKETALLRCRRAYVLADSSKFSQTAAVTFGRPEDAVILTTELKDESCRNLKNIVEVPEE